jgi:hypothetical protein
MYLISILNVYEVFVPLHMLWMGIWVHPLHSYTCACGGEIPKFGKLGLRVSPNNIMVSCLETANHPTLLLTTILHALINFTPVLQLVNVIPGSLVNLPPFTAMNHYIENVNPGATLGGPTMTAKDYTMVIASKNINHPPIAAMNPDIKMGAPLHSYTCAGGAKCWRYGI